MKVLKKAYYALSSYTDSNERRVAKFFSSLHEDSDYHEVRAELVGLLQTNIIAINLWSEYKYRQYKYLKKPLRRTLYHNARLIKVDFLNFQKGFQISWEQVAMEIDRVGARSAALAKHHEKIMYLTAIMAYLSPHSGRYIYRKSSTFGALLRDPQRERLAGDCNQIVTLYIYLYSLRYDISELQLKTLPEHVALHFGGLDIEATSASFAKYDEPSQAVLAIEQIVPLNLLDVSDEYFKTHEVSAEAALESARIAYIVSSQRPLVAKNLAIAYNNAVVEMVKKNAFKKAMVYAKDSRDKGLINMVGSNAALYYLKQNQFKSALDYAHYSQEKGNLEKIIYQNEGAYYFNKGRYSEAISAFQKINDRDAVRSCYVALFNNEQRKLGSMSTTDDIKNNRSVIYSMDNYAKKSGDHGLIGYVSELKRYL